MSVRFWFGKIDFELISLFAKRTEIFEGSSEASEKKFLFM